MRVTQVWVQMMETSRPFHQNGKRLRQEHVLDAALKRDKCGKSFPHKFNQQALPDGRNQGPALLLTPGKTLLPDSLILRILPIRHRP